jgi:hypothetical protein
VVCPSCNLHFNPAEQKKVPRRIALQRYENIRPTQRTVLWSLYYLGVLSQGQIGRIISDSASPKKRSNYSTAIIHSLINYGLVERHKVGRENLYTLSDIGIFICVTELGERVSQKKREKSESIGRGYWKHKMGLADIAVAFSSAERRGYGELVTWTSDELRYKFSFLGSQRSLSPDSYGEFTSGDTIFKFFVEFERAKYDRVQITDKTWRYAGLRQAWSNKYPIKVNNSVAILREAYPVVLYVADNEKQISVITRSICDGVSPVIPLDMVQDKIVFGLASRSDVVECTPFGNVWKAPLQGKEQLSFPDLFAILSGGHK